MLAEILAGLEHRYPVENADSWDAPGLVVGSTQQQVGHVRLSVDVTSAVVAEAVSDGVDLLVAHHPLLLRGVTSIAEESLKGSILSSALRGDLAIYSAHTNADVVSGGVSDSLAKAFGLVDALPLVAAGEPGIGHGRVGSLPAPTSLGAFAKLVAQNIPATAGGVKVSGNFNRRISKVAVLGGSGEGFIPAATDSGADVFVTSDLRHHPSLDSAELTKIAGGPALIDISHWAAEWVWLETAAHQIRLDFPDLKVSICDVRTDAWDFLVTQ